jgi:hypothetical protein
MSEFNLGREQNNEEYNAANNYTAYLPVNYMLAIRDLDNTIHYLSPVDAYTFLTNTNDNINSIAVFNNDKLVISFGLNKETPYSIFQQIKSADEKFKDVYETEFATKKAAGQEVYNPFSATSSNMNWKSVAKRRKNAIKNTIKRALPTFAERFNLIKGRARLGGWKGATPTPETITKVMTSGKLRSRKTRKNRR